MCSHVITRKFPEDYVSAPMSFVPFAPVLSPLPQSTDGIIASAFKTASQKGGIQTLKEHFSISIHRCSIPCSNLCNQRVRNCETDNANIQIWTDSEPHIKKVARKAEPTSLLSVGTALITELMLGLLNMPTAAPERIM